MWARVGSMKADMLLHLGCTLKVEAGGMTDGTSEREGKT